MTSILVLRVLFIPSVLFYREFFSAFVPPGQDTNWRIHDSLATTSEAEVDLSGVRTRERFPPDSLSQRQYQSGRKHKLSRP